MSDTIREGGNLAQQQHEEGTYTTQPAMSVKFNLDLTTVHKYEVEKEEEEASSTSSTTWYSRREIRSFEISTLRSVMSFRDRVIQAAAPGGDVARPIGLDDVCLQGIEILVSSPEVQSRLVSSHVVRRVHVNHVIIIKHIICLQHHKNPTNKIALDFHHHTHTAFEQALSDSIGNSRAVSP